MISLAFFNSSFLLQFTIIASFLLAAYAGNFYQDVAQTFGDQRFKILEGGQLLTLSLDKTSGSGFQSKNEYLFGRFDMQLKLISGNSAGTVATFYDKDMMRLILSSWETLLDSLTQSTPTFMLKEKVAGNNGFACGSIPQHPSTPIQLFGILKGSYSWWITYQ
ncbi:unnamed protein product [Coffea canephora]|uniref:DH200=94 genomic scaffold, scaffold_299 n=1 Tax=Coffea canephora TaxID=49390 RepID=A0A068VDF4_COFCA|nr:unnamed protein product [Coffea canephora]